MITDDYLHGVGSSVGRLDNDFDAGLDELADLIRRQWRPPLPNRVVLAPYGQQLAMVMVALAVRHGRLIAARLTSAPAARSRQTDPLLLQLLRAPPDGEQ